MFADAIINVDPKIQNILSQIGGGVIRHVQKGIYTNCAFNFRHYLNKNVWDSLYSFEDEDDEIIPAYGVVDSIEQFIDLFGAKIESSPNAYAVGFTLVRKNEQPANGGWRWHKWGEYSLYKYSL